MLDLLATVFLSPGVKGFFEDPRYLLGLPLAALGVLGLLMVLSPIELRRPQVTAVDSHAVLPAGAEGHPSPGTYIGVGIILAVITLIEVGLYYIELAQGFMVTLLLILSAMKFVLVVLWFMHLKFDSQLFSVMFSGALLLVVALFVVVLVSLGAGLT